MRATCIIVCAAGCSQVHLGMLQQPSAVEWHGMICNNRLTYSADWRVSRLCTIIVFDGFLCETRVRDAGASHWSLVASSALWLADLSCRTMSRSIGCTLIRLKSCSIIRAMQRPGKQRARRGETWAGPDTGEPTLTNQRPVLTVLTNQRPVLRPELNLTHRRANTHSARGGKNRENGWDLE